MLKEEMVERQIKMDSKFCCPICLSDLDKVDKEFLCRRCNRKFPVKENIPSFGKDTGFFFWDIPRENMESALRNLERVGWHETLLQLQDELPRKARKLWSRICNPKRRPWVFLLPLNSESRVLDFGAGWGNNSIALARNCKEVYSMDVTYPYLKWVAAYAREEEVKNIFPVQGGNTPHLPFKDKYFDAVILNGVLEWFGLSFTGDPHQTQMTLLKEVARVLKPTGCLYIGIENRISYKYFMGIPEGHIKMRFGSLLPRKITKTLLKILRDKDFRVYTYSMKGYRNMLKKAGLEHTIFLAPIPNYSLIAKFMPISESSKRKIFEPLRFDYSNAKQKVLMDFGGAHFMSSFSILASFRPQSDNLLKEIINFVLLKNFNSKVDKPGRITLFKIKARGRFILRLDLNNRGFFYLKVDTARHSKLNIIRANQLLSKLHESPRLSEGLRRVLPNIVDFGEFCGGVYQLEREVKGLSGQNMTYRLHMRDTLIRNALNLLKDLHEQTGIRRTIDDRLFEERFGRPISNIKKWMKEEERNKYENWFRDVEKLFYKNLKGKELLFVLRHGDFVTSNCITDTEGKIKTVLDWEFAEEEGLPLLDLVSFLNRAFRPTIMSKKYPNTKFPGYPPEFFTPYIKEITSEYMNSLDIPERLYKPLVFMWWVKHLEDWYPTYGCLSEWKNERIFPIIERWNKILQI